MPAEPLDIDDIDLELLILARNDAHPDGDWWFDPGTGTSLYYGVDDDIDLPELVSGVHVLVPHEPQPRDDIEDFLASDEVAELGTDVVVRLLGASRGKGALRRFREVVTRTPAAEAWGRFTLRRESVRAIDWLLERGLVEVGSARRRRAELASHPSG